MFQNGSIRSGVLTPGARGGGGLCGGAGSSGDGGGLGDGDGGAGGVLGRVWLGAGERGWVRGGIRDAYMANGGEGWLGFPTSDEFSTNGTPRQNFAGGYITWNGSAFQAYR